MKRIIHVKTNEMGYIYNSGVNKSIATFDNTTGMITGTVDLATQNGTTSGVNPMECNCIQLDKYSSSIKETSAINHSKLNWIEFLFTLNCDIYVPIIEGTDNIFVHSIVWGCDTTNDGAYNTGSLQYKIYPYGVRFIGEQNNKKYSFSMGVVEIIVF